MPAAPAAKAEVKPAVAMPAATASAPAEKKVEKKAHKAKKSKPAAEKKMDAAKPEAAK